ncbi:flagellin [uncultured Aureimonas sp.]|uniref:flagellin N-terminal helical domain-containing protein n=1 Tax=uncultured Aureimonas sp. TaxID=1604662 RepID=UPI0025FBEB53|nr:flagellin [uncultured Aureimonas sp.]
MTSVNFNAAATSALRTLQHSNAQLDATQSRIATGLKIGQAKDNAAYWSISTTMKSDNKALGTVKDALGLGAGTVDTAYQGLDAARAQLDDLKAKLTSALNPSVDRAAVQNDIDAYLSSLKSIASSSVFSGENWLSVNSGVDGYSSQKQVVASYARAADGTVSIDTIGIDTSKIALFDANADGAGIISSQAILTAGGKELEFGGNAASGAAPVLNGLDTASSKAGLDVGVAAKAKVDLGKFSAGGLQTTDQLTFDVSIDGGATKQVKVSLTGVTNGTNFASTVQTALQTATGTSATVTLDADGHVQVESATLGSASGVSISNLKAVDGNGAVSTITGYTAAALNGVANFGAGSVNTVSVSFDSTGTAPATIANNDVLKFRFSYNGDLYETASKTLQASDVNMSDEYATVLKGMMETATRVSDGAVLGTGKINVAPTTAGTTDTIKITTVGSGPTQTVSVGTVWKNGAAATGTQANGLVTAAGAYATANAAATTGAIAAPSLDGDTITFDMTYYTDNTTATGSVSNKKTISFVSSATQATNAANLQAALDKAYGAGVLSVNTTTGAISTVGTGPNVGLIVANAQVKDGDGVLTSTLGMKSGAINSVGRDDASVPTKATVTSSTAFAGELAFDAGDSMTFNVNMNDVTKAVKIDKALIDSTLGGTSGKISSANDYATVLNAALTQAGVTTVTAKNNAGVIAFEANTAGAATLSVTDVKSSSGANTSSVNDISITSASFKALTNDQQTQLINAYINLVSDKLKAVTSAASNMGSVGARIESQKTFVSTLMDTIDKGVSGLVDADMNEESTKLQALQVKQQLGVQALSIANQSAQNVLSLFRG